MSFFIKDLIIKRLSKITIEDVLYYGKQYGFTVTEQEARDIVDYVRKHTIDPFNSKDRKKAFNHLAQITSQDTAIKAESLFVQLIKSYGLDSLFD